MLVSVLNVGQRPTKGKMSELIPLKCSVLSLSTPLCCSFISAEKPGMFSLVCLIWPRGQVRHKLSPSVSIPPTFYYPLSSSSSPHFNLHWITALNHQLHHPACLSPSHILHVFNSSGTWRTLPLSLTFCWSAAQSNYLGIPHCKAHSITTIPSLITNHTPNTLTLWLHLWPLLPNESALPSVCCYGNRIKTQGQLVSLDRGHSKALVDKAIDSTTFWRLLNI